jgi:hypothetical protein
MKTKFSIVAMASVVVGLLAVTASAQYLTSTKAGFVNNVVGKAYILRQDSEDGEKGRATLGTQMRNGDKLSTGAGGYTEILLNPGSYLRLSENSELLARNTDFSAVRFELLSGSAILEIGQIDKKAPIEIVTPKGAFSIPKDGLYRVDVKNDQTLISVRQGEIFLGSTETGDVRLTQKFGRGKVLALKGSVNPDIVKIDKDASDAFDSWSFNRANSLTSANLAALRRNSNVNSFAGGWYFNSFSNFYTFMPFRSQWFSPYGFGFFNSWQNGYWYNPYGYGYGYGYGGYGGRGGGVVAGLPGRVLTGVDRAPIRRSAERAISTDSFGGSRDIGGRGIDGGFRGSSSSSPAVISAPAPSRSISTPSPAPSGGGGGRGMPSRN